jgi:anti-sigma regulatory factor (Ser/Thr protein kinase)
VQRSASLAAEPKSVSEARALLRGALRGSGIDRQRAQDVLLVTSELVENAILHGSRPGDRIEVEFQLAEQRLSLCVRDAGRGAAAPQPHALGAERTAGRGLAIVSRLARWSERVVDGRREVRAEIDL